MNRRLIAGAAIVLALAGGGAALRARRMRPRHRTSPGAPGPSGPSTTSLVLRVTDAATHQPVAARVLLIGADHQPLHLGNLDVYGQRQGAAACAIAPGVVGSWDGLILATGSAEVPVGADRCVPSPGIPYGRYHVVAWRGVEYERFEGEVDLSAGRGPVALAIALDRAWTPHGTLAADLHVHAFASTDSRLPNPQRAIAQAAAGVQVVGLSDHNANGDLSADITALGLDGVLAAIASDELTSDHLHVGVYPVTVARDQPHGGGPGDVPAILHGDARALFDAAHAMASPAPGGPIVQVNHPRFRYASLYDGARWDGVSWPPPFPTDFDAVEVLAGYTAFNIEGDRRFDDGVRDFYTFVDHGHLLAPLGNSDTHDLNWVLDGTTRTYVYVDDPRTQPFDQAGFVAAIRARRVVATSGPWLDVEASARRGATPTVGPGQVLRARGTAWLDITVAQAGFVHTDRVRITVGTATGPAVVRTLDVPPGRTFHWAGALDLGTADTWIGVTADGDTPLPLEQTGSYQQDKWKHPGVTPFAIASPILIDANGDGRWHRGDADLTP